MNDCSDLISTSPSELRPFVAFGGRVSAESAEMIVPFIRECANDYDFSLRRDGETFWWRISISAAPIAIGFQAIHDLPLRDIRDRAYAIEQYLAKIQGKTNIQINSKAVNTMPHVEVCVLHGDKMFNTVELSADDLEDLGINNVELLTVLSIIDAATPWQTYNHWLHQLYYPPADVSSRVSIYSYMHAIDDIIDSVSLPDWPIFRRDIERDSSGGVVRPSRWKLRPGFIGEQVDDCVDAVAHAFQSLFEVHDHIPLNRRDVYLVNLELLASFSQGRPACAISIPHSKLALFPRSNYSLTFSFLSPEIR